MAKYVALVMQEFDGDSITDATAEANAIFIKDQTKSLAQQSAVSNVGLTGERASYCLVGTIGLDGNIVPINGWYLDSFGVVRDGYPGQPEEPGYPAWIQPVGSQDAYPLGARVSHNGSDWESTYANNVWEPGVFGWIQI
jgi:hypothetical protein